MTRGLVLEHDIERNNLALRQSRRRLGHIELDFLARAHLGLGLRRGAVEPHVARFDQGLDAGARKIFGDDFRPRAKELVKPLANSGLVDLNVDLIDHAA